MGTDKTDPFDAAAIPVFRPYDNIVMIIINISLVFCFGAAVPMKLQERSCCPACPQLTG